MINTYRFIEQHPLTKSHKAAALARWLRWQVVSRLSPYPSAVPFVNGARLLIRAGMTGATGNLYCGLHEFEDMAFVLHLLRAEDLFVDIGANVGSYSILAATTGADTLSFEPVRETFEALLDNVHLNRMQFKIDARCEAIGSTPGTLRVTADGDTTNRALAPQEHYEGISSEVPQVTLDQALMKLRVPKLIKIDVEGYEARVLAGAENVLSDPALEAVILELNGSGARYGGSDRELHDKVLSFGFQASRYVPRNRTLHKIDEHSTHGNTLYVRNPESVMLRVSTAPAFKVLGQLL